METTKSITIICQCVVLVLVLVHSPTSQLGIGHSQRSRVSGLPAGSADAVKETADGALPVARAVLLYQYLSVSQSQSPRRGCQVSVLSTVVTPRTGRTVHSVQLTCISNPTPQLHLQRRCTSPFSISIHHHPTHPNGRKIFIIYWI